MANRTSALRVSQKWEYSSRMIEGLLSLKEIDDLGMEGWEMCGIAYTERVQAIPESNTYYFKRPL